jgi:hypothetical protein
MVLWMAALAAVAAGGCSSTKSCTEIGCASGFTATVRRADGSFPTGMHRLEITADRSIFTCTFMFAGQADPAAPLTATCQIGAGVQVAQSRTCMDVAVPGGAITQECVPIPGQFDETISLSGTPSRVDVRQYVDDVAILDVGLDVSYQQFQPNGAGCEPVCRQASVSWTLQ